MTGRAWAYVGFIYLFGGFLLGFSIYTFEPDSPQIIAFLIFTILATVTQLLKSEAPSHQAYHPALIFFFAGVLLLDPFLFYLLVIISHLAEWFKERLTVKGEHLQAWYIQPFNISMHIILGYCAMTVFNLITSEPDVLTSTRALIAVVCSAVTYAALNHLMVGLAISLARGVSIKESGIWAVPLSES